MKREGCQFNLKMQQNKEPITEEHDDLWDRLVSIRDKCMPYQRYIMIVGFTMLILLVVWLGYVRGALDVCNDLGGRLEVGWKILCHPGQNIPIINSSEPRFNIFISDFI